MNVPTFHTLASPVASHMQGRVVTGLGFPGRPMAGIPCQVGLWCLTGVSLVAALRGGLRKRALTVLFSDRTPSGLIRFPSRGLFLSVSQSDACVLSTPPLALVGPSSAAPCLSRMHISCNPAACTFPVPQQHAHSLYLNTMHIPWT